MFFGTSNKIYECTSFRVATGYRCQVISKFKFGCYCHVALRNEQEDDQKSLDDISKLYQQHSGRFLKSRLVTRDPVTTLRSGMAIVK